MDKNALCPVLKRDHQLRKIIKEPNTWGVNLALKPKIFCLSTVSPAMCY